ncbi:UDP-glucose/GDP-mannose dehydrogenase family protein [Fulvimarina sp. 2208YS6-2-32]|uniref:UDP-glucose 6-dehydrogenase n=1 Tax=Fulvimarina uroteuthidis TaxID=3098149 RepID=A0ABU5I082_9HYPH|nr:UDP-glucose/GDP-mannose dehydrogenase family protein [Fulvimarina sp. 2208YS6-2-32]MDY8108796.1 UDP-glucose/GDP-mannose dehydrogenase family protein [Fulvimarina sp. 2208YS6-2-32]
MLNVCVLGTGYVGLVTGACLADLGHAVTCIDIDPAKIEGLARGEMPIYEPGLDEVVARNGEARRLSFGVDPSGALGEPDLILIVAVGTPSGEDGSADLRALFSAVDQAAGLRAASQAGGHLTIVIKSTVPVGTCRAVEAMVARRLKPGSFSIVSNPEFLREGCAIEDFTRPDRIVVGSASEAGLAAMRALYAPLTSQGFPLVEVGALETSEMIKYAANVFLATRIGLVNEFAQICERVGADVDELSRAVGADRRIGPAFLKAGPGFGGSCFPKDLRALTSFAADLGCPSEIAGAVIAANERQKHAMAAKIEEAVGARLCGRRIALLGLAFKAGTDDVREAPALSILSDLIAAGASVTAYDPAAGEHFARLVPGVRIADRIDRALADADAVVIATEWPEFLTIDWMAARLLMRRPVIVDLRNHLEAKRLIALGFTYRGVGRHASPLPVSLPAYAPQPMGVQDISEPPSRAPARRGPVAGGPIRVFDQDEARREGAVPAE